MPPVDLSTTNLLLGILAAVSLLEAMALVAAGVMGYRMYRELRRTVADLEARHVAPLAARVNEILVDVKSVTARVHGKVAQVDETLTDTLGRVDETAGRVTARVREKTLRAMGVMRGIRAVLETMLARSSWRRTQAT